MTFAEVFRIFIISTWERYAQFEEIIRELNAMGYSGPLSVEWEDSGMERFYGGKEACEFVEKINFSPSNVAFDDALKD